MNNPILSQFSANAMLRAGFYNIFDGGILQIYSGVQPPNEFTSLSTQVVLCQFNLGTPAFALPGSGLIVASAIPPTTAIAAGTAAWFKMTSAGVAFSVLYGSVGLSGCDLNLNAVLFAIGDSISITSGTIGVQ